MAYIQGADRNQIQMYCLDDMVDEKSIARLIDMFIDGLNFSELGFDVKESDGVGRNPYHPKTLAKILLFGYHESIRSSRKLEKACKTNIEMMWLAASLVPDHKTIADFRKNNLGAIQALFDEFGSFCEYADLVGKATIVIDGTKIGANNSKKRMLTQKKMKRKIEHHTKRVEDYLDDLAKADDEESADKAREQAAHHQEKIVEATQTLQALEQADILELGLTDNDARTMGDKTSGVRPSYNVQTMVDAKAHIVTSFEAQDTADDHGHITRMANKASELLRTSAFDVVADKGYWGHKDIEACEQAGINAVIAPQAKAYGHDNTKIDAGQFIYDETSDSYLCPEGHILSAHSKADAVRRKFYNKSSCQNCSLADKCLGKKTSYRIIWRAPYSEVLERAERRYLDNLEIYALRQQTVEHVFGTVKNTMGARQFLLRGKEKVQTEAALLFLAYNIKRAANALGFEQMMSALKDYFQLLREHGLEHSERIFASLSALICPMRARLVHAA